MQINKTGEKSAMRKTFNYCPFYFVSMKYSNNFKHVNFS